MSQPWLCVAPETCATGCRSREPVHQLGHVRRKTRRLTSIAHAGRVLGPATPLAFSSKTALIISFWLSERDSWTTRIDREPSRATGAVLGS